MHKLISILQRAFKKLCNGKLKFEDITEKDCVLNIDQKGVDMKIGLDIASLSYRHQVNQIILISGDSDFVSAAKLARREGIDFILDPLGASIKPDLFEHIDGLNTCDNRYRNSSSSLTQKKSQAHTANLESTL
ncbi:MAG: NYN domain-containing protein [Thomasclavelia sp.]